MVPVIGVLRARLCTRAPSDSPAVGAIPDGLRQQDAPGVGGVGLESTTSLGGLAGVAAEGRRQAQGLVPITQIRLVPAAEAIPPRAPAGAHVVAAEVPPVLVHIRQGNLDIRCGGLDALADDERGLRVTAPRGGQGGQVLGVAVADGVAQQGVAVVEGQRHAEIIRLLCGRGLVNAANGSGKVTHVSFLAGGCAGGRQQSDAAGGRQVESEALQLEHIDLIGPPRQLLVGEQIPPLRRVAGELLHGEDRAPVPVRHREEAPHRPALVAEAHGVVVLPPLRLQAAQVHVGPHRVVRGLPVRPGVPRGGARVRRGLRDPVEGDALVRAHRVAVVEVPDELDPPVRRVGVGGERRPGHGDGHGGRGPQDRGGVRAPGVVGRGHLELPGDLVPGVPVVGVPLVVADLVPLGHAGRSNRNIAPGRAPRVRRRRLRRAIRRPRAPHAADLGRLPRVRAVLRVRVHDLDALPGGRGVVEVRLLGQGHSQDGEAEHGVRGDVVRGQAREPQAGVPRDPPAHIIVAIPTLRALNIPLQETGLPQVVLPAPAPLRDRIDAHLLAVAAGRHIVLVAQQLPEDMQVPGATDGGELGDGGAPLALPGLVGLAVGGAHLGGVRVGGEDVVARGGLHIRGVLELPHLGPSHHISHARDAQIPADSPLPPAVQHDVTREVLPAAAGLVGPLRRHPHTTDVVLGDLVRELHGEVDDDGVAVGLVHGVGVAVQAPGPVGRVGAAIDKVVEDELGLPGSRVVRRGLLSNHRHRRRPVRPQNLGGTVIIRVHLDLRDAPAVIHTTAVGQAVVVDLREQDHLFARVGVQLPSAQGLVEGPPGALHADVGGHLPPPLRTYRLPRGPGILPHALETLGDRHGVLALAEHKDFGVGGAPGLGRPDEVPGLVDLEGEEPRPTHHRRHVRPGLEPRPEGQGIAGVADALAAAVDQRAVDLVPEDLQAGCGAGVDLELNPEVIRESGAGGVKRLHADGVGVPGVVALRHFEGQEIRRPVQLLPHKLPLHELVLGPGHTRHGDDDLVGDPRVAEHHTGPAGDVAVQLCGPLPLGGGDKGLGSLHTDDNLGMEVAVLENRIIRRNQRHAISLPAHLPQLRGEPPLGQHARGQLRADGVLGAGEGQLALVDLVRSVPEELGIDLGHEVHAVGGGGVGRAGAVGEGDVHGVVRACFVGLLEDPSGAQRRASQALLRAIARRAHQLLPVAERRPSRHGQRPRLRDELGVLRLVRPHHPASPVLLHVAVIHGVLPDVPLSAGELAQFAGAQLLAVDAVLHRVRVPHHGGVALLGVPLGVRLGVHLPNEIRVHLQLGHIVSDVHILPFVGRAPLAQAELEEAVHIVPHTTGTHVQSGLAVGDARCCRSRDPRREELAARDLLEHPEPGTGRRLGADELALLPGGTEPRVGVDPGVVGVVEIQGALASAVGAAALGPAHHRELLHDRRRCVNVQPVHRSHRLLLPARAIRVLPHDLPVDGHLPEPEARLGILGGLHLQAHAQGGGGHHEGGVVHDDGIPGGVDGLRALDEGVGGVRPTAGLRVVARLLHAEAHSDGHSSPGLLNQRSLGHLEDLHHHIHGRAQVRAREIHESVQPQPLQPVQVQPRVKIHPCRHRGVLARPEGVGFVLHGGLRPHGEIVLVAHDHDVLPGRAVGSARGALVQVAPGSGLVDLDPPAPVRPIQHAAELLAALPRHAQRVGVHVERRRGPLAVRRRPGQVEPGQRPPRVALRVAPLPPHHLHQGGGQRRPVGQEPRGALDDLRLQVQVPVVAELVGEGGVHGLQGAVAGDGELAVAADALEVLVCAVGVADARSLVGDGVAGRGRHLIMEGVQIVAALLLQVRQHIRPLRVAACSDLAQVVRGVPRNHHLLPWDVGVGQVVAEPALGADGLGEHTLEATSVVEHPLPQLGARLLHRPTLLKPPRHLAGFRTQPLHHRILHAHVLGSKLRAHGALVTLLEAGGNSQHGGGQASCTGVVVLPCRTSVALHLARPRAQGLEDGVLAVRRRQPRLVVGADVLVVPGVRLTEDEVRRGVVVAAGGGTGGLGEAVRALQLHGPTGPIVHDRLVHHPATSSVGPDDTLRTGGLEQLQRSVEVVRVLKRSRQAGAKPADADGLAQGAPVLTTTIVRVHLSHVIPRLRLVQLPTDELLLAVRLEQVTPAHRGHLEPVAVRHGAAEHLAGLPVAADSVGVLIIRGRTIVHVVRRHKLVGHTVSEPVGLTIPGAEASKPDLVATTIFQGWLVQSRFVAKVSFVSSRRICDTGLVSADVALGVQPVQAALRVTPVVAHCSVVGVHCTVLHHRNRAERRLDVGRPA
mmetsp:Transcript_25666/g.65988  ORF Transcript_25666/g.65988 Transcript_25666/m.65988 type:complete len:2296 (+) Transcript_25666:1058-7945(+)